MSIHTRVSRFVAAAAATLCLAPTAVLAFEPPSQSLAERVASADAVVQAVVAGVQYRMSSPSADQPSIPFTFVTFNVERVLRGRVAGDRLTLRFHGGLFPDGRFLDDPSAPLFDVGERSILLVDASGDLDVPLVGWRFGRLRVVDGRVYDDFGKPLAILGPDRVEFGRTVRLAEVVEHRLGATGRSFNPRLRELPAIVSPGAAGPDVRPGPRPADPAAGMEALAAWVRALRPGAARPVATSADPTVPFMPRSRAAVARAR